MPPEPPRTIWDLTRPGGGRLFFPYGEHPAGAQLRRDRTLMIRRLDRNPTIEGVELLEHVEQQILKLEIGEMRSKARAAQGLRRG